MILLLLGTFDVQNITREGGNSTHFCFRCIFALGSRAAGCAAIDSFETPMKIKGRNISSIGCLPIPPDRDSVEVFVKDIDANGVESKHFALLRTFTFTVPSNQSNTRNSSSRKLALTLSFLH